MVYNVPILLLTFNRPETTIRVFERITQIEPQNLYIASDSPRQGHPEDKEKISKVLHTCLNPSWDCNTHFFPGQKENKEGRLGIVAAIDWFFEHNEYGIIFEDDCVPDLSFFSYCSELLERYKDNDRIGAICGSNFQFGHNLIKESYYFSKYPMLWGYGTWKRVWKYYDIRIKDWPVLRDHEDWLKDIFPGDRIAQKYWMKIFDGVYEGSIYSHDYQIAFLLWKLNAFSIIPASNLISNIGFGSNSTHTSDSRSPYSNMPTEPMKFPMIHPTEMVSNIAADMYTQDTVFESPTLYKTLRWNIGKLLGRC